MITLSAAEITAALSNTRTRGGAESFLKGFVNSGEMYAVVNEHPNYANKSKEQLVSVKNALTTKAKALDLTDVKFVKVDGNLVIVNTSKLVTESE